MNPDWLLRLALLAVIVFWVVGAYNRLLRRRNALASAWERLAAAGQQRGEAMTAVVEAVREPLAAEAATLAAVAEADARLRGAADAARPSRGRMGDVSDWTTAEAALASPASRLRALIELQPALLAELPPDRAQALRAALAAWREAEPRMQFARQGYNDAAQAYNHAVLQWPTRLLSALFRLRPAGRV